MSARQNLKWIAPALAAFLVTAPVAYADDKIGEAEEAKSGEGEPLFEASLIGTYQAASDGRVKDEAGLRPEVIFTLPVPAVGGNLVIHVEGSTTPRTDGVTTYLPDANGNIGPATNSRGHGRLQFSEVYYEFEVASVGISAGLIDTSAFIDASAFAGDEHSQFMNATLVHNATIEFPDYTLGVAMTTEGEDLIPGVTLVAGSSSGLGDNPTHNYNDLFDVRSSGKGVFAAAELGWGLEALGDDGAVRVGAWTNTADHAYLDGTPGEPENKGVYGVLEGTALGTGWSLRGGVADESVSAADWFVGAALQRQLSEKFLAGIGATQTGANDKLGAGFSDSTQAEVYVKYDVLPYLNLTPSLQWIRNPGFDDTEAAVDQDNYVLGLRVGVAY
ncbi:MAG: carbohydrate porin [Parvibaculum sp.]|nr:carbohydrate porin [Parvibaculum sp.]